MSVQPVREGTAPWWPAAPPPRPSAASAPDRARSLGAVPVLGAALGGVGVLAAASDFFLTSSALVIGILASAALAGAIAGAVLGAWGLGKRLGEVSAIGILAAGLSLPLGIFDLVVALAGHLA